MIRIVDGSEIYVNMCMNSEEIQKIHEEDTEKHTKQFNIKLENNKMLWLPCIAELLSLLGFDQNDLDLFQSNMDDLFKDIKDISKKNPFVDSMEKALLLIFMESKHKKFFNLTNNIWESTE